MNTVKKWADIHRYEYLFIGDELFNFVSKEIIEKTISQPVIATDLARLMAMRDFLYKDYDRVIWCDADFLIFVPTEFVLSQESYLLGREVWIQKNNHGNLSAHIKVHNAFMVYTRENTFLPFYIDSAIRLLTMVNSGMPPQFIGPKLLTALHNVVQCPVLETAGMLSPLVISDLANQDGPALRLFKQRSTQKICAANLCSSLCETTSESKKTIETCINKLLTNQSI